jgi:hypothetical protein
MEWETPTLSDPLERANIIHSGNAQSPKTQQSRVLQNIVRTIQNLPTNFVLLISHLVYIIAQE